jgi:hypothetical protein
VQSNFDYNYRNRQLSLCQSAPHRGERKSENDNLLPMAARPKLTPVQVHERLHTRLDKRMEALQRKLAGFEVVITGLETELDYLTRAARYLEE